LKQESLKFYQASTLEISEAQLDAWHLLKKAGPGSLAESSLSHENKSAAIWGDAFSE